MNEKYIEKHYPKHSVFEEYATRTKKAGIGVYLFFGAIFAGISMESYGRWDLWRDTGRAAKIG